MKKGFHAFFFFTLILALATTANAEQGQLSTDQNDTKYINMPATGTLNLNIPEGVLSFKVYDDGGEEDYYSDYAAGYLVLTAPAGYVLEVSGTVNTELGYDYLEIYDGNSQGSLLKRAEGEDVDIGTIITSGNTLTFYFYSDYSASYDGLDLTVSLVDASIPHTVTINQKPGGNVVSDKTSVLVGETVSLTVTPRNDSLLNSVEVVTASGVKVDVQGGTWYTSGSASFTMPLSNVSVTPLFVKGPVSAGNLFVNMPQSGEKSINIPASVATFKVYDEGGANGDYGNNASGRLVLTAPEGTVLNLTGWMQTEGSYDNLIVYDGLNGGIIKELSGDISDIETEIGTVYSTGNTMVLEFESDESVVDLGFELTVSISAAAEHTVTIADVSGGYVSGVANSVMPGQLVSLNAVPEDGYYLSEVLVDGTNDYVSVNVNGGTWYSGNTASFTMPNRDVTITPVFSQGTPYVNMPANGGIGVVVPDEVTSFKIYDDGGEYGDYSDDAYGEVCIGLPAGKTLQISGGIDTEEDEDYLRIKDEDGHELWRVSGEQNAFATDEIAGSVCIVFESNDYDTYGGFELTVDLSTVTTHAVAWGNIVNGTAGYDKDEAYPGELVTITANPNTGYLLSGISVIDSKGNPVKVTGGTWATENVGTFMMPSSNVEVTPLFTDDFSVAGGLYINMPKTSAIEVSIPEGVSSFMVYDDGGVNGSATMLSDGTLELVAPVGYRIQVQGRIYNAIMGMASAGLVVYDGDPSATVLGSASAGYNSSSEVETMLSSGNVLTLNYYTSNMGGPGLTSAPDLELTVTLVAAVQYTASLGDMSGGTAVLDKYTPYSGEQVTVSATPNSGYLLKGVNVVDSKSNAVKVEGGLWASGNTATFFMPEDDVTVTPQFTDDLTAEGGLYINMPKTASMSVDVPAGVTSFKVYDDGGVDGVSRGDYGSLELTAPEGFVFQVSGSASIDAYGYLFIYDREYYSDQGGNYSIETFVTLDNYVRIFNDGTGTDLDLTIRVIERPDPLTITVVCALGGNIDIPASAQPGEKIDMVAYWAEAGNFRALEQIGVVDAYGDSVPVTGGKWYSWESSFRMPMTAVTVEPVFVQKQTAEDGLSIDMPLSGRTDARIPKGVKSFKVYDNGGSEGYVTTNTSATLTLQAPSGYVLRITGTADLGSVGALTITSRSSPMIAQITSQISVGPYESDYFSLRYYSDQNIANNTYTGFDLRVDVVRKAQYAAVSVEEDNNGNVIATIDGAYNETDAIDIPMQIDVDEVVFNRTFSMDGYSTITLPFAIDVNKVDGLAHAYAFDAMGYDANGKKQVEMVEVNSLEENTPYIIELSSTSLTFNGGVTLMPTDAVEVKKGDWEFRGTFQKKVWSAGDPDLGHVYGYSAEATENVNIGQFVKAAAGAWIRPLRAYLIYNPDDGSGMHKSLGYSYSAMEALPESMDVVVVSRDSNGKEEKKVIGGFNTRTGEFTMERDHDIKGRKLNGEPKARGVYYGKMKVSK